MGNFRSSIEAAVLRLYGCMACLLAGSLPEAARAGAWLMPPGAGQIITGAAFSGTTRAFDARGRLVPVPYYRKFELGTYVEYGLTERVTLVAAPAYDRIRAPPPAESYNGLGESELGARLGLYRENGTVVSVQAGFRTPGPSIADSTGPFDPRRSFALDLRALVGRSVEIANMPAFVDVQAGYRLYTGHQPGEWRIDLTLGLRPFPRLLGLIQLFSSISTASGVGYVRSSWYKLASSVVYDLHPQWSIQGGCFLTLAGANAGRELGPFASLWYRF